jgi:hypothetical protein
MPLTAAPMTGDAPIVARTPLTQVLIRRAAVRAKIAMANEAANSGTLYEVVSGMIIAVMPM